MGSEVEGGLAGWGAVCLKAPPLHPPSGKLELGGLPSPGRKAQTDAWVPSAGSAPILGRSTREKEGENNLDSIQPNFTHLGICTEDARPHTQIPLGSFSSHRIIQYAFLRAAERESAWRHPLGQAT